MPYAHSEAALPEMEGMSMARALRSNLERGSSMGAARRAQWRALGLSDADMTKPKIAVVNSSSELAICFSHLDGVAAEVKQAIRAAGGYPFEVRTAGPSDFGTRVGRRRAGERIGQMVWDDLKPRDVITPASIANAVMAVLALSGSINCVKHLQAIAAEAEIDLDVYGLFSEYADRVPLLAAIKPSGDNLIEELGEG